MSPSNEQVSNEERQRLCDAVYNNVYGPVAMAKHSNPNMQRLHLSGPKLVDSGNGPIVSEASVGLAEHALLTAVYATIMGLYGFANYHLPVPSRNDLLIIVRRLELDYADVVHAHNDADEHATPGAKR